VVEDVDEGGSVRSPNDSEFTDFVHGAWPGLYRTAYLLVGDAGLAEDLVQTSLAKTYASWGDVRDVSRARGYARTVLVNTATSWFRRRSWRREVASSDLTDHSLGASAARDDTDRLVLIAALGELPVRQRAVVVLRFYEDLSVEQTADLLSISSGTVKSQTSHALTKLRAALGSSYLSVEQGAHHD
jgi:RNA polymerase sigma-70 factor (sigma-E family)